MTSRQYKLLVVLVVVAGLVGGLLGSWLLPGRAAFAEEEVLDVVKAKQFVLVGDEGKTRATLQTSIGQDGGEYPILILVDEEGNMRAALCLSKGGNPAMSFYDDVGAYRLGVKLLEDGRPNVGLITPGKGMVGLGIREDGLGLTLADAAGKQRTWLGVLADGSLGLSLLDAAGKQRMDLSLYPDGSPGLGLLDAAGNVRAGLSLLADGSPGLGLCDAAGKTLWQAP